MTRHHLKYQESESILGIITDTIAQTMFLSYFKHPRASLIGTVVSMLQAGAAGGAGIAAPMNDRLGRKKAMMIGAACGVVGAALQAGAVSIAMLIVGRKCLPILLPLMLGT